MFETMIKCYWRRVFGSFENDYLGFQMHNQPGGTTSNGRCKGGRSDNIAEVIVLEVNTGGLDNVESGKDHAKWLNSEV
jgi:hypothetical protein